MNVRDKIDNTYSKLVAKEMVKVFNKAYRKIMSLPLTKLKDADFINSIIKDEYNQSLLTMSNFLYSSTEEQYRNNIRILQAQFRKSQDKDYKYNFDIDDKTMLDLLDKQNTLFLSKFYDENLNDKIVEKLKQEVLGNKTKKEIGDELASILQWSGKKGHQSAFNLVTTNNTWTRSIAATNLMETAGVIKYKYLVFMDNVTSPICRALHNKTGEVKKAISLRDNYLSIPRTDYQTFLDKANEISPMIAYDENSKTFYRSQDSKKVIKPTWTDNDLMDIPGISLPPFHINCRTEIVISS